MKTIMHYLQANKTHEIMYKNGEDSNNLTIKGYSNSDWANNQITKKLTSGFIFILNDSLVSWYSKNK